MENLLVLFGGVSPEHEVSVITGLQVLNNADSSKYNVIPLYISKDGQSYTGKELFSAETYKDLDLIPEKTKKAYIKSNEKRTLTVVKPGVFIKEEKVNIDCAFPCFHGGVGENGGFQGLFEVTEIPYVGSDVLGSSVGMDKVVMKQILEKNNINVAPYEFFYRSDWENNRKTIIQDLNENLKYPLFVKPANAGSSIGITKVVEKEDLVNAIEVALAFDRKVIVEEGIKDFKEINISVIGIAGEKSIVSANEEVFASKDFLNYEDKYVGEGGKSKGMASAKRKIPAELNEKTTNMLNNVALKAFDALNAGGLARIDFLVDEESQDYYLIEINTIPGSMSFYLWEASGLKFTDMIDKLVETAQTRYKLNKEKTTTFASNILKDFKPSLKGPKSGKF